MVILREIDHEAVRVEQYPKAISKSTITGLRSHLEQCNICINKRWISVQED